MAAAELLRAACPVGTLVGTLTWGRLQVLEASFMAFRMLPEKVQTVCEASRVLRPGGGLVRGIPPAPLPEHPPHPWVSHNMGLSGQQARSSGL